MITMLLIKISVIIRQLVPSTAFHKLSDGDHGSEWTERGYISNFPAWDQ